MKRLVFLCAVLVLTGCGLHRQTVRIEPPEEHANPLDGKPIVLAAIVDARAPSTDLQLDASDLSRNVGGSGRGGNGFAVQLEDGTVADRMRDIIVQSLRGMGYKVVDAATPNEIPRVQVKITQFAVTIPFQFWRAATYQTRMLADISAEVTLTKAAGASQTFTVKGHGYNVYQRVIPENWQIALNKAVADFSRNFQSKMAEVQ